MKIVIGIATTGRPRILLETLREIAIQVRTADEIVLCPASPDDIPDFGDLSLPIRVIISGRGSSAQRNAILDATSDSDIVVFFDDDFFPDVGYLAAIEAAFSDPSIVIVTGRVILDGIIGPGIPPREARAAIADVSSSKKTTDNRKEIRYNAYGCNFAVRVDVVQKHSLRFDEGLPLYGWLEDVDFSRQVAPHGLIVRDNAAWGVHLGTKMARTPGLRLGYSQIVNPVYLWRKGTMRGDLALSQIARNVMANMFKIFHGEPWADRRGRAAGNLIGFMDLLRGRLDPGKITRMNTKSTPVIAREINK